MLHDYTQGADALKRRQTGGENSDPSNKLYITANDISIAEKERIIELRKKRREEKSIHSFVNIFEQPIVKDYLNSTFKPKVYPNRLVFGSRNHWAKKIGRAHV